MHVDDEHCWHEVFSNNAGNYEVCCECATKSGFRINVYTNEITEIIYNYSQEHPVYNFIVSKPSEAIEPQSEEKKLRVITQ